MRVLEIRERELEVRDREKKFSSVKGERRKEKKKMFNKQC